MNASKETKSAYFNYIGSIELPLDVISACAHDCQPDIDACMELPEIKAELAEIDPEMLVKELSAYGAWQDHELKDHDTNLMRILLIAAGKIEDESHGECPICGHDSINTQIDGLLECNRCSSEFKQDGEVTFDSRDENI